MHIVLLNNETKDTKILNYDETLDFLTSVNYKTPLKKMEQLKGCLLGFNYKEFYLTKCTETYTIVLNKLNLNESYCVMYNDLDKAVKHISKLAKLNLEINYDIEANQPLVLTANNLEMKILKREGK